MADLGFLTMRMHGDKRGWKHALSLVIGLYGALESVNSYCVMAWKPIIIIKQCRSYSPRGWELGFLWGACSVWKRPVSCAVQALRKSPYVFTRFNRGPMASRPTEKKTFISGNKPVLSLQFGWVWCLQSTTLLAAQLTSNMLYTVHVVYRLIFPAQDTEGT